MHWTCVTYQACATRDKHDGNRDHMLWSSVRNTTPEASAETAGAKGFGISWQVSTGCPRFCPVSSVSPPSTPWSSPPTSALPAPGTNHLQSHCQYPSPQLISSACPLCLTLHHCHQSLPNIPNFPQFFSLSYLPRETINLVKPNYPPVPYLSPNT